MKALAVSGASGKDVHIKIRSVEELPAQFKRFLRKTIAYSKIPECYGPDWDVQKVLKTLKQLSTEPVHYSYGGRAPHVAYGIAKLGGDVRLITVFGKDLDEAYPGFFGGGYWSHLKRAGVKMTLSKLEIPEEVWRDSAELRTFLREREPSLQADVLQVVNKETPTIVCCKDLAGVDFFYIDDVNGASYVEVARPAPEKPLQEVDAVFVTTSETSFMEEVILTAHRLGKEVLVDVGSYGVTAEYLRKIVPLTKVIFGNLSEMSQVCEAFGVKSVKEVLESSRTGLPEAAVVEDKIEGSIQLITKADETKVGPVPMRKSGNSIGCCDGIAAGFLFFYQHGLDPELCAKAGLVLCSSIWEVEDVQSGFLNRREFYERFLFCWSSRCANSELKQVRRCLKPTNPF